MLYGARTVAELVEKVRALSDGRQGTAEIDK